MARTLCSRALFVWLAGAGLAALGTGCLVAFSPDNMLAPTMPRPIHTHIDYQSPATVQGCVNMLSGLNATRHPVHKAAKPAPASQTNSAREHSVCAIKPLKSVRGSPTRPSHRRDHRDNTRRITRSGKKPFPPEQIVPHTSAITRQLQSRTRNTCIAMPAQAHQPILHKHRGPDVSSSTIPFKCR